MGKKHCRKRRNCSLIAISPFLTMFSNDFYCKHSHKNKGLFGKGLNMDEYQHMDAPIQDGMSLRAFICLWVILLLVIPTITDENHLIYEKSLQCHSAYVWWWEPSYPSAITGGVICIRSIHNRKHTALHTPVRNFLDLGRVILTHTWLKCLL